MEAAGELRPGIVSAYFADCNWLKLLSLDYGPMDLNE